MYGQLFLIQGEMPHEKRSPFLQCAAATEEDQLVLLHLKRDLSIPTILRSKDDENEGYDEGKVQNTRFGSFPHSTLIGTPWGSQVRASAVDTGSRGRKGWEGSGKKRKRGKDESREQSVRERPQTPEPTASEAKVPKAAVEAQSGFVHILPPTPELWTASLPHRTQVVYTPDYSYILHRIRARPGTRLVEAGAGSGSFTHAAARAVFDGYPEPNNQEHALRPKERGKVYSFEFHEPRAEALKQELHDHGLDGIVELTSRDVCSDGFILSSPIQATAIFLDLPAPWLALQHLTRSTPISPLDPNKTVHLCTFSPCIEQVQRTITTMRQLGWLELEMVEIAAKKIEVRRERVGLQEEGLRGVNDSPANVEEAVGRLREVEGRSQVFHEKSKEGMDTEAPATVPGLSKQQRLHAIKEAQEGRKLYKEGRMVTRDEPELKTHTSYLVFAILPRQWTDEDERRAREAWPEKVVSKERGGSVSRRGEKKAAKAKAEGNKSLEDTLNDNQVVMPDEKDGDSVT